MPRDPYAASIVETVRQPLVVLDADLRVRSANRSFYKTFQVLPEKSEGRLLHELGERQWESGAAGVARTDCTGWPRGAGLRV